MKSKKQFTNRILSLVLTLVMLLGMLPMSVFAAEPEVVKSYSVATLYSDGTLEIFADVSNLATIPWQNERASIKKVVFKVETQLSQNLFSDCTNLAEITLPSTVTEIPRRCFNSCTSLTSIAIPDSVTSIGERAFSDCKKLSSITFGANSQLQTIGIFAFNNCDVLESIAIPDTVTSIGSNAFNSCDALANIVIPDSVTSISNGAFSACKALASIALPDSVTSIGERAFYGCDALASITIPNSVASIGEQAFYGCNVLTDIYYEGTSARWEEVSKGYNAIPNGVTVHTATELTITGISDGDSFPIGTDINFTAIGKGMDNASPVEGDYQYRPFYWKVLDSSGAVVASGDWVEDNTIEVYESYNASIDTDAMSEGQYTLIVACSEWQWQSGMWTPQGGFEIDNPWNAYSTVSVSFELYCTEHSGGTATCTEEAVCSACGQPYGDTLGHDWGNWISNNDGTHTRTCANDANHTETNDCSGGTATCTEKAKCSVCAAAYGDLAEHTYGMEWKSDGTNHWHECSCGAKKDEAAHSGGTATCTEKAICSVCGQHYGELALHSAATEWRKTETHHFHLCIYWTEGGTCQERLNYEGHADEDNNGACDACGYTMTVTPQPHTHSHGSTWVTDESEHWNECSCGDKANKAAHTYEKGKCTVCGAGEPNYVPETDSPQTGDNSNIALWNALLFVSSMGLLGTIVYDRKKKHTK